MPEIPSRRLSTLLQQSVKWQCHTGTFPTMQRLFRPRVGEGEEDGGNEEVDGKKKKKKKRKKNTVNQTKFNLVLGNVDVTNGIINGRKKRRKKDNNDPAAKDNPSLERIPSRTHRTIPLGKKSYIESACFLPDGRGLVTGSSNGFIEVWGSLLLLLFPVRF